jgi:exopolysaccharide biosynthesis protein
MKRPCLVVTKEGRAKVGQFQKAPTEARAVVAGNQILLEGGKDVTPEGNKDKHPRTAVGTDRQGKKLVLLVVDGRRPGVSVGMTYAELAAELLKHDCTDGLNLDGGGSTALVARDEKGWKVLNQPSDGRERPVANVLGIKVNKTDGAAKN